MKKSSVSSLILQRIETGPRDKIYVVADFLDLGNYHAVRKALLRLSGSDKIRKVMDGIYYYPEYSPLLKEYEAPSPKEFASAVARKFNWTIAPCDDAALNELGLSTQVVGNWSFVSDGPYREFKLSGLTVKFKHCSTREIASLSKKSATVVQAIEAIGKGRLDNSQLESIRHCLSQEEKEALLRESSHVRVWVKDVVERICEEGR